MTLTSGSRLGHYEILSLLGAGGKGQVYRARDTKLGREVALKILPEAFAQDPEKIWRFEREAHVLASLNHPNIATLYGFEESAGLRFLVMELVPGETLAQRLTKGPLAVQESIDIFRQIAEGIEAAHEKSVIHRDLKPSNIKVTADGKVKVLDFGLAKALGEEPAPADLSGSPTATYEATGRGVILGTAAYMSPEQARGKAVDKRTDIWSFGCVFYEALNGRKAFSGETLSGVTGAILHGEPDWQALPKTTPWRIQDLLRRCLEKDPRRRLHDIADVRIEIEHAPSEPSTRPLPRGLAVSRWIGVVLVVAAIGNVVLWSLMRKPPSVSPPLLRFAISLPPSQSLGIDCLQRVLALSSDGTRLAYVAGRGGTDPGRGPMGAVLRRLVKRAGTGSGRMPWDWAGWTVTFIGMKLVPCARAGCTVFSSC